jgi:hypothetical protein
LGSLTFTRLGELHSLRAQQAIAESLGLSPGRHTAYLSGARAAAFLAVPEELDDAQLEVLGTPAMVRSRNQMIYQVGGDDGEVQVEAATYGFPGSLDGRAERGIKPSRIIP